MLDLLAFFVAITGLTKLEKDPQWGVILIGLAIVIVFIQRGLDIWDRKN